jgi:uncharacterized protein (UPF0335 family)
MTAVDTKQARDELRRRARAVSDKLDEIAELQGEVKELKLEAKSDGYDMKAFGQIIKEMRRGPDFQADQLTLELVIDTYRVAVGLPTDLEVAQEAAREASSQVPGAGGEARHPKRRTKDLEDMLSDPALDGTAMSVGDGPFVELGSRRRAKTKEPV